MQMFYLTKNKSGKWHGVSKQSPALRSRAFGGMALENNFIFE